MWFKENPKFYIEEMNSIANVYPGLNYVFKNDQLIIEGQLGFSVTFNDLLLTDHYEVQIQFPDIYPKLPPKVIETGNRIPASFHTNFGGFLCLGTEIEIAVIFSMDKTILNFIKCIVVPYLFGYSYFEKNGSMPLGERDHGLDGIKQFYLEKIGTDNLREISKFLKMLYDNNFRGHYPCFCNSGKKFRDCHRKNCLDFLAITREMLIQEIRSIGYYLK